MVCIKALCAMLPIAAIVQAATVAQVLQDITNIDTGVRRLIRQTSAYDGGIIEVAPQLATLGAIYAALATGVAHSGSLPKSLTAIEADLIIKHVNNTLTIDNPIAVDTTISKKPQYEDAHVAWALGPSFEALLAGHSQFTINILNRIPEEKVYEGAPVVEKITIALRKGIAAFEKK